LRAKWSFPNLRPDGGVLIVRAGWALPLEKNDRKGDMKGMAVVLSALVVLAFAIDARSQTPAETKTVNTEDELLNLMHDWMNAEVKRDMAFLDRFIAEDWLVTDPAGAVWTKEQFLAGLKSGEGAVLSFELDNVKVRVYGDAAVVTGRMTAKQTFKGQDISGQYQCTDTLVKKAGRWQCVATHLSAIARKQG
jgi:ketosteroid isomerase-like protein